MQIFIHGHGSVSAAGTDPATAWDTYVSGTPTWSVDAATGLPVYRVPGLPRADAIARFVAAERADRATHLALRAAERAVAAAGWRGEDFAILVGCSRGPTASWEAGYDHFRERGTTPPRTSPQTTLGGIGFALARYFGTGAVASSLSVTCSSGLHALLHGVALLRAGMAERVLVGGAEAPLTPFTLRQLEALRIYGPTPREGTHACRPLAEPASGMIIGEGAAFFALTQDAGQGPRITASDAGQGPRITASDAGQGLPRLGAVAFAREHSPSPTGISADGLALQRSIRAAVAEAGTEPDLVIAHAPGTPRGDAAERAALRDVLGTGVRARTTSGKWATGHTFGASGPLGLDLALRVLERGTADGLAYRPGPAGVRSVLVNATGFGGNAVSVLVRR